MKKGGGKSGAQYSEGLAGKIPGEGVFPWESDETGNHSPVAEAMDPIEKGDENHDSHEDQNGDPFLEIDVTHGVEPCRVDFLGNQRLE